MPEVIENQRWYPIVGWTARLHAEDPPAWCTTRQEACSSTDEQKDFVWTVYKGEDYDEEGWLYGEKFNDTLGPMTRSSVARTRVWMGSKQDGHIEAETAASRAENGISGGQEVSETGEWQTLFPSNNKREDKEEAGSTSSEVKTEVKSGEIESAKDADKEDNVLFPSADDDKNSSKRGEPARSSGFFGRFSSAVVSLPSSAINLAGSSSKQAVYGTVQSIKEASLFGLEMAQAATAAAISTEPQIPPAHKGKKNNTKNPDEEDLEFCPCYLSPVERSLVTCCEDSIPKYLSPPELTESKQCKECDVEFGMTKFRYQCGYCSESFCRDHLPESAIIRAYGHTFPSKLCKNCHYILMEKIDQQLVQWRIERVKDYLEDKLIVYYNTATDTAVDKIMRAAGGTLVAAKSAPIGAAAKMAVVSADFLRKYGRAGLIGFILRNEFMQSFSTLKGLLGDLDDLGFQDAAIGTYYFMAMNRGDRGAEPEGEKKSHDGCEPASDEFLTKRISRLQGFSLIYAHVQDQDVRHPSFALLSSKESKTALVLIRGSKSVQDALTDIQAYPEEIGLSSAGAPQSEATGGFVDAFAHNGMLKAVMWIKDRIVKSLRVLHNEGYHIVFAGHSLGAGCAALLSVMLQKEFEDLECFAYAVPACVNLGVAESCNGFVHSIVLRDDIVPRTKASNVMKLVGELKTSKDAGTRAKTLWAPRKREWAKEAPIRGRESLQSRQGTSPTDKPTLAEKNAKEADKDEGVSSWTLTRTNLIDQLDKIGDKSTEDETLEPSDERVTRKKRWLQNW
ncbi:Alpha/Beta hydrolase fold [Phytophthora cactorum]|nr:Alpha/Beta hydrolase fold [Phytophthora cactorum]